MLMILGTDLMTNSQLEQVYDFGAQLVLFGI